MKPVFLVMSIGLFFPCSGVSQSQQQLQHLPTNHKPQTFRNEAENTEAGNDVQNSQVIPLINSALVFSTLGLNMLVIFFIAREKRALTGILAALRKADPRIKGQINRCAAVIRGEAEVAHE